MVWYGMVWYRGQTIIGSAHRFGPIFATSAEISDRQHLTNIYIRFFNRCQILKFCGRIQNSVMFSAKN